MMRYLTSASLRRTLGWVGVAAALPIIGCTDFLGVPAPDIILQANSPSAAIALHNGAVLRLAQAVSGSQGPDALFMFGGLLTDEWRSGDTFIQRNSMDQRIWDPTNTFNAGPFRNLNRVRTQAQAAIDGLRAYAPSPSGNIGRMFALTTYVETLLGEHYCNGTPLSSLSGSTIVYGAPISNDSVFQLAIATADSALANVVGDSAQLTNFAYVIKGRARLDRGDFAGAAAAVATVGDAFHYDVTHSVNVNAGGSGADNQMWALNTSARRYTLGDLEGGNGLPYRSARDPRVPTDSEGDGIFDSAFPFKIIRQGIWGRSDPVKIATGIEARLIEAEAALKTNNIPTWLAKLNGLRANPALLPVPVDTIYRPKAGTLLAPLTDPGASPNDSLRVNLMFRERAFWMFSTGHRLGDMRRLLRQYGRTASGVYPTGAWFKGGNYGDAIQMSIPIEELNNPSFAGCTDRNP